MCTSTTYRQRRGDSCARFSVRDAANFTSWLRWIHSTPPALAISSCLPSPHGLHGFHSSPLPLPTSYPPSSPPMSSPATHTTPPYSPPGPTPCPCPLCSYHTLPSRTPLPCGSAAAVPFVSSMDPPLSAPPSVEPTVHPGTRWLRTHLWTKSHLWTRNHLS